MKSLSVCCRPEATAFCCVSELASGRKASVDFASLCAMMSSKGAAAIEQAASTLEGLRKAVSCQLAALLVVTPVQQGNDPYDNERVRVQVKTGHSTYHRHHPLSILKFSNSRSRALYVSRPPSSGSTHNIPCKYITRQEENVRGGHMNRPLGRGEHVGDAALGVPPQEKREK